MKVQEYVDMEIKYKSYRNVLIIVLNCLAILFMVYVVTAGAGYTVFSGDDFTNSVRIGAFRVSFFKYLAASLHYMKDMYFDWQGTYFAMFIQSLLSPLNNFGLIQMRIVMVINALLFFGSLFGMVWTVLGFVLRDKIELPVRLTIFTVILFAILDANVFSEIFFWYCGAAAYAIPFSFTLLSVMFFLKINNIRYKDAKQVLFCVCSAILLFLASGGPLAVTGIGCYTILLLTVGFYLLSRKLSVRNIIVTAAGVLGAVINVIAPGNFARHEYGNGESWKLLQSVKWAVKNVLGEAERLTKETLFGVMLIAMLMVGIYLAERLREYFTAYGIVSVLAMGTGFVTAFPVALGYGGPYFPNRCYFLLDVILVLTMFNFAVFIGCLVDRWAKLHTDRRVWAVLWIILFSSFILCPEALSESALMAVAGSKHNGSYQNYYEECAAVYDYLENCTEEDVVLEIPEYIDNFECFYLDEDENGWVNVGVARYYNKNSVRRKPE